MSQFPRLRLEAGLVAIGLVAAGPMSAKAQARPSKKDAPQESRLLSTPSESSSRPSHKSKDTGPAKTGDATQQLQYDKDSYRIGVEDDLQISVWREPELSGAVTVRPDGMITLPLLNDIPVVGLKTEELQSLLTEKLKAFVNEPQVTIIVRAIRSRKVFLFGSAARQGSFPLNSRKTVLELLAEAGGLGQFAKSESIYILRKEGSRQAGIPFSYKNALTGRGSDVVLQPGDMVVVP